MSKFDDLPPGELIIQALYKSGERTEKTEEQSVQNADEEVQELVASEVFLDVETPAKSFHLYDTILYMNLSGTFNPCITHIIPICS